MFGPTVAVVIRGGGTARWYWLLFGRYPRAFRSSATALWSFWGILFRTAPVSVNLRHLPGMHHQGKAAPSGCRCGHPGWPAGPRLIRFF